MSARGPSHEEHLGDGWRRHPALPLVAPLLIFTALATLVAFNKLPWCDEGWYGAPAIDLLRGGTMGTPNFFAANLPGIREHTYWEMPGFLLALTGWFAMTGVSLLKARALTICFGALVLWTWNGILRLLGAAPWVRALALFLVAVDSFFILDATYVRADMLGLLLQSLTYFAFLRWRERSLRTALILANTAAACAGLTHPNAGLLALCGLAVLAWPDRRRIRFADVLWSAVPYVLGAAGWGAYILQDRASFIAQFSSNAGGRFSHIVHPLASVRDEVVRRYLTGFGLGAHGSETPALVALKAIVLLTWLAGVAGVLLDPTLRRSTTARTLLALLAVYLLFYTFLEGTRTTYYLIWIVPVYSTFVSLWVVSEWRRRGPRRFISGALLLLSAGVSVGASLMKARQQWGMRQFHDVVSYLRQHPEAQLAASIEFGYALGFTPGRWIDDSSIGEWSGTRPDLVVVDQRYAEYLSNPRPGLPDWTYRAARTLSEQCEVAYGVRFYQVYRCSWGPVAVR